MMVTRIVKKFGITSKFTKEVVDDIDEKVLDKVIESTKKLLEHKAKEYMLKIGYRRTKQVKVVEHKDVVEGGCSEECNWCGKHKEYYFPLIIAATVRGYYVGKKKVIERPYEEMIGSTIVLRRGNPYDDIRPYKMVK